MILGQLRIGERQMTYACESGELADGPKRGSLDSGSHMLSENMWIVWFRTLYGQKVGGHDRDTQTDTRKCEDRARIREAGFAKTRNSEVCHICYQILFSSRAFLQFDNFVRQVIKL